MVHFSQRNVLMVCSCGSLRPIIKLYFCRHCIILRCNQCIASEVDGVYCSNCLENLAPSEAKVKKNRCGSCFECPNCFHVLSFRATISRPVAPGGDGNNQPMPKPVKSYFLACYFCRWTSRDVNIPDQPTATSSNWPENENPHTSRILSLIDYYTIVALRDRLEKEKKMFHLPRRGYQHFSEKFGLTAMIARKKAGLPPLGMGRDESISVPELTPSEATDQVEVLPEDIFTQPVNPSETLNLRQRFLIPDRQPETVKDLFPVHKHLSSKRALRCKTCLHNIFKPEYNPGSIKFKIYSAAYYYVPEIKLMKLETFRVGESVNVSIKLCNPAQSPTSVQFFEIKIIEDINRILLNYYEKNLVTESEFDRSDTKLKKAVYVSKIRPIKTNITGHVDIPDVVISLSARDDAAEYDDSTDTNQFRDNPDVVTWRKGNKVVLKLPVTANEDLRTGDDVVVAFIMRYVYCDKLVSVLENKQGKNVNVDVTYILNVGSVSSQ